jgi:type IV pilus assembly protein PilC
MSAQSTYAFRARDAAGQIITGSMVASNAREVSNRLRAEGKFVVAVEDRPLRAETQLNPAQLLRNEAAKRVGREDVIAFCQQLSIMLETGVPLAEAMDAFYAQAHRKEFRMVIDVLRQDVYGGEPFSSAMTRWPRVFPRMMVSLMKASEASGTMAMMLGRVAEYLAKERRTAKQIKGALSYPLFMMAVATLLTVFLMVFVLPKFAAIYAMRSASLPGPTLALLNISEFVTTQYMVYGPILGVAAIAGALWIRSSSGKRSMDWLRLNMPVIRGMYRHLYLTRAARTMATLLGAGVSLLDIIEICRGVTNNCYYDELWNKVAANIRDGNQLSDAVANSNLIPPNIAAMINAGERSGRLVEVMQRIASFSEEELDNAVKQATAYIEPVMIVTMGILVGGVAMALLLPVFKMGNVMAGA